MRTHSAVLFLLLAGLAGCADPSAAPAGTAPTMRRATGMGVGVRVASYAKWNERCEQAGLPEASVPAQPPHGTLSVRPASILVGGRRFSGGTDCRDRTVPGIELWYMPDPGFRGTDPMEFAVNNGEGTLRFRATVDVR